MYRGSDRFDVDISRSGTKATFFLNWKLNNLYYRINVSHVSLVHVKRNICIVYFLSFLWYCATPTKWNFVRMFSPWNNHNNNDNNNNSPHSNHKAYKVWLDFVFPPVQQSPQQKYYSFIYWRRPLLVSFLSESY